MRNRLVQESECEQVSVKDSEVSWRKTVPSEQVGGFVFPDPPQIPPPNFCFLFCRVLSAILMQSTSIESTRSTPESISPDCSSGGFNTSGFCCVLDEPRADYAILMHPSIDHETRSTPLNSSELFILGRLIDLR